MCTVLYIAHMLLHRVYMVLNIVHDLLVIAYVFNEYSVDFKLQNSRFQDFKIRGRRLVRVIGADIWRSGDVEIGRFDI